MCMHDMKNGLYELVDFLKQCFYVQKSKMELFFISSPFHQKCCHTQLNQALKYVICFKVSKLPRKS